MSTTYWCLVLGSRSESAKRMWANPEYREKHAKAMKKVNQTPEFREKMSKSTKNLWINPEYRKNYSEKMKTVSATPEYRKRMSENAKKLWTKPDFRAKMSEIRTQLWDNPEHREKMSNAIKNGWAKPGAKEAVSGENSHMWKGGISKHPYPFEFNDELKQIIKERDGWKCVLCKESQRRLQVHHINYIKNDSRSENLITLCVSCHAKTGNDRDYWEPFLMSIVSSRGSCV